MENQKEQIQETKDINEPERLINKPAKFTIGSKQVRVEAQPAGAVTCIIKRLIEKAKMIDLEIMKKLVAQSPENKSKEKKKGIAYKDRSKRLSGMNLYITNLSFKLTSAKRLRGNA